MFIGHWICTQPFESLCPSSMTPSCISCWVSDISRANNSGIIDESIIASHCGNHWFGCESPWIRGLIIWMRGCMRSGNYGCSCRFCCRRNCWKEKLKKPIVIIYHNKWIFTTIHAKKHQHLYFIQSFIQIVIKIMHQITILKRDLFEK